MELISLVGSIIKMGDLVRLQMVGIQAQHLRSSIWPATKLILTQWRQQGAGIHAEGQEGMEIVDEFRQR